MNDSLQFNTQREILVSYGGITLKISPYGQDVKQLPSFVWLLDTTVFIRLHRIYVAQTPFCMICDICEDMDADHIHCCPALKGSFCAIITG
ncbi:hypothetical protein TNCV_2058891 [Trichonephila clavipes]|nr:hypothetical protein TNCV_2058891 [Trichonephila clavipes]